MYVQAVIDDDVPMRPDPRLDDLASAQARRAMLNAINWGDTWEDQGAEPRQPWPVVVHG